ncbi:hypothetical protein BKP35_17610 [Anaerobacillus arseniciselenatis]|uniref:Uncharacterized protein n=1 Tax=Anaerobacillus arseniciselenatis TaxID=85682 RepID=A0A1S2LAE3_9BACI|nr:hypothetical protein [Anaerobacillus arseniciselenatis]OIJ08535.1 hypothetical protein BKP35_17610 [Anaerobacillus arseniciselenatis]
MNIYMFVIPVLLVIGLFGLYDKVRLFRRNGVFPSDSRLYRWFALLFLLVLPVRNLQNEFQYIKAFYYVLIPVVVIWLLYIYFKEGKGYTIVDISEKELVSLIEKSLKQHKVKFIKQSEADSKYYLSYKLGGSDATIVLSRAKDILNETHPYSYTVIFQKWWLLPNSDIMIDDLIRRLQRERETIKLRKQRLIALVYGVILFVGVMLAMNNF